MKSDAHISFMLNKGKLECGWSVHYLHFLPSGKWKEEIGSFLKEAAAQQGGSVFIPFARLHSGGVQRY